MPELDVYTEFGVGAPVVAAASDVGIGAPRLDEIHVCDADEVVRAVLSNASPKSAAIISDMHTERLQNAADGSTGNYFNQYVFTCQADHEAADYLVEWAHVIRKDLDGNAREFRVRLLSTGRDNSGKATKTATCDGVEMELGKKRVRPVTYTGSTASAILPDLLAGTRFTVGDIEWGGIVPVQTWENYPTVWACILDVCAATGLEPYVHVVVQGSQVVQRIIDLVRYRGSQTPSVFFTYGHNLKSVTRTADMTNIATSMLGVGASGTTMSGVAWSVAAGDPLDKPLGQDFLADPTARDLYGLIGLNGARYDCEGYFEDSSLTTAEDVLVSAYARLMLVNQPQVTWAVDAVMLERYPEQHAGAGTFEHEAVRLGDLVGVVDPILPESLSTPVPKPIFEMNRSYVDATLDSIGVGVPRRRLTTTLSSILMATRGLS